MPAPFGEEVAGGIITSVAFFLMAITTSVWGVKTTYWVYHLMAAASYLRGTAMAMRSASVLHDETNKAEQITYFMFLAAGFGLAVDMQCLSLSEWFKNTHADHQPPLASLWAKVAVAGGPCAIIMGPGLGVANAVLQFGSGSDAALHKAAILRKISACGMTTVCCMCVILSLGATLWTIFGAKRFAPGTHPHQKVAVLVVTSSLLVWAAVTRVVTQFSNPTIPAMDELMYPLQVLPELLQMAIWCVPFWVAEAHHSSKFDTWQEQVQLAKSTSKLSKSKSGKSLSYPSLSEDGDAQVDVEAGAVGGKAGVDTASGADTASGGKATAGVSHSTQRSYTTMDSGLDSGSEKALDQEQRSFESLEVEVEQQQ